VSIYIVLFLLGFILAIGLLAYASMQVSELNKKAESFGKGLVERYSKPQKELSEAEKKAQAKANEELKEELKAEDKK
jgi:predicted Holliday junction resolvase-like endonuclease